MDVEDKIKKLAERVHKLEEDKDKLVKENQELKKEIGFEPLGNADSEKNISRRDFLKKVGIGAIGLGALSIPSASALNMRSNDFTFYGADSTPEFQINDGGPVEIQNADLDLNNNNLIDVSKIDGNSGNHRIRFDSNNSWIEFTDQSNNRNKIVTQDTYINALGAWLSDNPVNGLDADTVDGQHASDIGSSPTIFGDGSNGSITYSSNSSAGGRIQATTFEIQSGATLSVNNNLIVHATESITINGTIDAKGEGANGASPSGKNGDSAQLNWSTGSSGGGGASYNTGNNGGAGAGGGGGGSNYGGGEDGGISGSKAHRRVDSGNLGPAISDILIMDLSQNAAAGGGSGGKGSNNGSAGGAGGNGGGFVALMAPEINISGTIDVRGQNGDDGNDYDNGGAGGGGGGGAGGIIQIAASSLNENSPGYLISGGAGGIGGTANTSYGEDGGDGGAAHDGAVLKSNLP